ncbi:MAG TPA: ABC transporter substrate-binding protein [Candidatus Methylomirabilis sp.]|nr:ABC transporter substrate-binding protein [Candidatus Methylomirabilis sp.]
MRGESIVRRPVIVTVVLLLLASWGPALAQDTLRTGGVLKAAMIGEPPTLDVHTTTATIAYQVAWHMFEGLYTFDKNYAPIPMLAEGHAVADGGRRYTITLRKGVRFHNGKELTAADAAASLSRWGRLHTTGKTVWKVIEAVEAKDPYTLVIHLKEPSGSLLYALASPYLAIYPKSVVDAAGDLPIKEYIGTGPFQFVEHKPDRHIRMVRFKDYAARSEPADGLGGKRIAAVDEILFIPVPDVAVRLAGIETGEYHFAQSPKQDQYDRLKANPKLDLAIVKLGAWITAALNHKQGVMTNKKVRQAMQAVLDMEPIMAAAIGTKDFYRLDGALYFPEQTLWHSSAGVTGYNLRNKERARALLREAGYAGQPVRWITTKEYEYMYNSALVARQQMEEVGFKVDLQVLDWATLVQRRNKPELWDVFTTGITFSPDPALSANLQCNWPGWWCHEEKERLLSELVRESEPKKRRALIERIQAVFYDDVGRIKMGDFFTLLVTRNLKGFEPNPFLHFWNVGVTR